jgi:hypothetical protein
VRATIERLTCHCLDAVSRLCYKNRSRPAHSF